jgi:hypothetical protein
MSAATCGSGARGFPHVALLMTGYGTGVFGECYRRTLKKSLSIAAASVSPTAEYTSGT